MLEESHFLIRKFEGRDREALRQIMHDTAFMGQSAEIFFQGREVFTDALTLYFTDYEPESSWVAEVNSEIVGCLIGTQDKRKAEAIFKNKIFFSLLWRAFKNGVFWRKKNIIFLLSCLKDALKGNFVAPDFTALYPATLHINVKAGFRGRNIGSGLMRAFLSYLKENNIAGVHLATMSQAGADFFTQESFQLLYTGSRSYFRHILGKDVMLYIYGLKLECF